AAHATDCALLARAEPQVTMVEQEVDAMLLRLDRVVLGRADTRELLHAELVAAGRAGVIADAARHFDAGLEGEVLDELPDVRRYFLLDDYALYDTRAVAHDDESDAPVNACRLDPAPHGGAVRLLLAEVPDI